jgi:hypothetical protein
MGEDRRQEAGGDRQGVSPAADNVPSAAALAGDGAGAPAAGLRIVYCGGCNPHIDRGAVAGELEAAPAFARPGSVLYLSGCPRACASAHQLTSDDPAAAVVAGAHVDGVPTPAQDIAATVGDKLKE